MTSEEIVRYDDYWQNVAKDKMIPKSETKALEILNSQSKNEAGPCLSTIYDPELDVYYYGQNFQSRNQAQTAAYDYWIENEADPIIYIRYKQYKEDIETGRIILDEYTDPRIAAHSEIRALDEAIKARRAAGLPVTEDTLKELYVYNIDLRKLYKENVFIPKCRCPNCMRLTEGINAIFYD